MRPPALQEPRPGIAARGLMYVKEFQAWVRPPVRTGGNTVPNGRPIIDETRELTSFFSCPPSWEPEEFEKFSLDGDRAAFLIVVLITEAKRPYAIEPRLAPRARIMEDTNDGVVSGPARANLGISS